MNVCIYRRILNPNQCADNEVSMYRNVHTHKLLTVRGVHIKPFPWIANIYSGRTI